MGKPKACWECHSRRLICDFGRPGCQKCQSRNTTCPGYGPQKPLKWLQPGQTRSKGQRARKEANIIKLTLKDPSGSTSIFEAIEYYNTHICPDLAANGTGGGSNCSWVLHPGEAPYIPIAIRHTLVSIALAHRVLQSEQGFEEDRALFSARLQKHRGEAIRYLAEDLKAGSQPDAITLASILTFLLAEIQQSFSSSWRQHCDAANAVVDLLGGMETVMRCYIIIRPVVRYFVLIEILSTTTAPTVEEARTRRQVDIAGFLSDILNTGLCTSIPCPPELLAHIVLVNDHLAQTQAHEGALFCIDSQISAMNLLHRIRSFSVEKWAIEIDFNERKLNQNPNKPLAQRQSVSWDWQSVAYVYQSAVVLYCISSLLYPQYTQNTSQKLNQDTNIEDLRSAYLATLLCNLRDISSNSKLQLRKLLLWPLVIAGIEVDVNDEESKRFILGELAWISKVVGTAPPLVARDFLVKLWASDWIPTGYGRGGWNTIFDRPHVALAAALKRRSEEAKGETRENAKNQLTPAPRRNEPTPLTAKDSSAPWLRPRASCS
ncbi:C6 zinc finger domain-containing [Fusarium albosuccineum]|uniref:C6 zinc finger domain-containing n=1 Tax=Fusarium albosuccineum TaxID=1237068 RepID=A0A8H4L3Z7_9HYPO|nr:C6 zinc finger domain-containing [Fusarium albosuccineum]